MMILNRTILFAGAVASLWLAGCGTSNPVVAKVGNVTITQQDFEESYARNNGGWEAGAKSSLEERQRFLDLVVKFQLKVREAKEQKLEQDSTVRAELQGYEQSLAQTYMVDKELIEPAVKGLYERKKFVVRASHILLRLSENASPAETLQVWERARSLIAEAAHVKFDSLAIHNSQDQSVSFNKGDLGFFGTGRMVSAFEDACFALPPGTIVPAPVRTQFGYHVIKVTDRKENQGAVQISHILLRAQTPEDTAWVRDTVSMLMKRLAAGESFDSLVVKYSMDPGSVPRGGEIGSYDRDRLPPDLADLLYATKPGTIAKPFFAPYGAHIFRVNGFTGVPAFADIERDLKQQYQQMRYTTDYQNYVHKLKSRYSLNLAVPVVLQLYESFDTTKTPADTLWDNFNDRSLFTQTLLSTVDTTLRVRDVLDRFATTSEFRSFRLTPANVDHMLERMGETLVLEAHARRAVERHPVFADLMKEYRDGILLYQIEQQEVWAKIVVNDSLLMGYYDQHKEQYRWPDRVNFAEIYVTTDSLAKVAIKRLSKGEDFVGVAEDMTMRAGYRDKKGVWGFQPAGLNNLATMAMGMPVDSVTTPFRNGAGFSIIKVLGKEAPRVKTFAEAGPEISGAYQEQASKEREREWVASLRARYGVTIDTEAIRSAFTQTRATSR